MEYAISEIVADQRNFLSDQTTSGRLITTDLHNYAVPFIRFDTQDVLIESKELCNCGRKLLPIKKILGRDNDILVTPKGKFLIVHNFTGYFQNVKMEAIDQFQIIQDSVDHIIIRLVVNKKFNQSIKENIYSYWTKYIGDGMRIEIHIVSEIELTPSGKRRFLIRDKTIDLGF
jgi:phenylacetate-CoA ligase